MPVVLRHEGFRFFFYSNEGNPREPLHIHVRDGDREAKFWVHPTVTVVESRGYDARTLRELSKVIHENTALIERAWNEFFT